MVEVCLPCFFSHMDNQGKGSEGEVGRGRRESGEKKVGEGEGVREDSANKFTEDDPARRQATRSPRLSASYRTR